MIKLVKANNGTAISLVEKLHVSLKCNADIEKLDLDITINKT